MFKLSFRSFLPMMEEDDGLDIGGTGAEELEPADPVDEEGVEDSEPAEPNDSREDVDAAFAQQRRQIEALTRQLEESNQKNKAYEESVSEYERALGLYFEGENKAAQAIAYHDEIPVEQVVNDMLARKEAKTKEAEIESLRQERDKLLYESMKAKDLDELRKAGITDVNDVEELGEEFFQYRTMGIPAKVVYDGMQMKNGTPPKPIGKVKPAAPEKDYFTPDEVHAMSSKEKVKNFEKIRDSMLHWK